MYGDIFSSMVLDKLMQIKSIQLIGFLHHGNTQIRQIGAVYMDYVLYDIVANGCIACENLVGFSIAQPSIFKRHQLLPVRDLQLLVGDYRVGAYLFCLYLISGAICHIPELRLADRSHGLAQQPIAKNALTILINLSTDVEVLEDLAGDNAFLETLLARVTVSPLPFYFKSLMSLYSYPFLF
jgi:hypothetical protein